MSGGGATASGRTSPSASASAGWRSACASTLPQDITGGVTLSEVPDGGGALMAQ
jgi:hypothetical protein